MPFHGVSAQNTGSNEGSVCDKMEKAFAGPAKSTVAARIAINLRIFSPHRNDGLFRSRFLVESIAPARKIED
jgi:hypothetical protein